jgi:hypothetical protein
MENLPLGNFCNYQSLINLVRAPHRESSNAVTDTPGALTNNVNGQDRGASNTRLDGAADIWSRCLTMRCTSRPWKALKR